MRVVLVISALFAALAMTAPGAAPEAHGLGNLFKRQGCIDSPCCGVCRDAGNCQVSEQ